MPPGYSLGDFAQCATFLTEIHDKAYSATLNGANTFLDSKGKVRLASADVRTEHIGTITYGGSISKE